MVYKVSYRVVIKPNVTPSVLALLPVPVRRHGRPVPFRCYRGRCAVSDDGFGLAYSNASCGWPCRCSFAFLLAFDNKMIYVNAIPALFGMVTSLRCST